jgi:hypothetical protein
MAGNGAGWWSRGWSERLGNGWRSHRGHGCRSGRCRQQLRLSERLDEALELVVDALAQGLELLDLVPDSLELGERRAFVERRLVLGAFRVHGPMSKTGAQPAWSFAHRSSTSAFFIGSAGGVVHPRTRVAGTVTKGL